MKLVIIEGEGKKDTIGKYLKDMGPDYLVMATKGHVRDLPKKRLAVDIKKNFEPTYQIMPDKKTIIESIKKQAKKADEVYLATDPDREGEAISWHLAYILGIPEDKQCRIVFNEITQKSIERALQNPRPIDKRLVDAQQARRVLDRLVGYKVSPVICKKIRRNLSAGRVQSVTLRLIVERENEIKNFKPEEYWVIKALLDKDGKIFPSLLIKYKGKKVTISNKAEMEAVVEVLKNGQYKVAKVTKSVTKSRPPAPYITSTMQQDALSKLGMTLKTTSAAAQQLYEGVDLGPEGKVALVTYIRTDSVRVSPEAQAAAREFIIKKFGPQYAPQTYNVYKSKKNVQDAHEAIRPISLERTPQSVKKFLSNNNYKLYKLIYERFLASQMTPAEYDSVTVDIDCSDYTFRAKGKTLLFPGYTAAYENYTAPTFEENGAAQDAEGDEGVPEGALPDLEEGQILRLEKLETEQKFTKPPARYTDASLVKAMEERGIGRPATYVPTILILFTREYVVRDGKYIVPTELGIAVTEMLIRYFPDIMDVDFTAKMEDRLDEIENGGIIWQNVIADYYSGLEDKITYALNDEFTLKEADQPSDVVCEKCGVNMVIRSGRFGKFLACPNFPKCRNTKPLENQSAVEEQEEGAAGEESPVCEKCGSKMVLKNSKFGKFWGCPNYPQCRNIKTYVDKNSPAGTCPLCQKPLVRRRSKRGKMFYGCSGYPECNFISNDPVAEQKCPQCGSYMIQKNKIIKCSSKECGYQQAADNGGAGE